MPRGEREQRRQRRHGIRPGGRAGVRRALAATLTATALGTAGAVLAACGAEQDPDPRDAGSGTPTDHDGPVEHRLVEVVTVTGAGGKVSTSPTPLPDSPSLLRYAALLRGGDPSGDAGDVLADEVTAVVEGATVAEGDVLAAAVVRVGCGTPTEVVVERVDGRLEVSAEPAPDAAVCEAPETSVAVVEVPAGLLPVEPGATRSIEPPDPD
ncbi:hypothetical protein [Nocardioides sambongensis]|uniref:hypothetical protein n=1 Tax=Nocardioides sambongensis TaxID=2589074 RepID=UPI00112D4FE2|nr:hypothetical protein [Nocardioides sambongensis]